jgi:hypothetical protein
VARARTAELLLIEHNSHIVTTIRPDAKQFTEAHNSVQQAKAAVSKSVQVLKQGEGRTWGEGLYSVDSSLKLEAFVQGQRKRGHGRGYLPGQRRLSHQRNGERF